MRAITLEEHFATPEFLDGPGKSLKEQAERFGGPAARLLAQLCDVGQDRVSEMDAVHIDVQVLSLTSPGTEQLEESEAAPFACDTNDYLADALRKHPDRFYGFATLPTCDPRAAAAEFERTVHRYGFKGALINGHVRGRYLDDKFFWPIFECAESLKVPIYLHPTQPPKPVIEASYGGFPTIVTDMFAGAGWGWHIETALHVIRIILGGTFDRFPRLQLIVGHMGETLPFMLPRLDSMPVQMTKLQSPISHYLRENLFYTFSGFNFTPTFINLLLEVGIDRIMFSADYPYSSMTQARTFLDQIPVSPADRERIAYRNAEQLLRL